MREIFAKVFSKDEIISIENFQKPTTNNCYIVTLKGGKYFCRTPNKNLENIVDFAVEKNNLLEAAKIGLTLEPIYIDDQGTIIKPYIENGEVNDLKQVPHLLAKLHNSKLNFKNRIDCFRAVDKYFALLKDQSKFTQLKSEIAEIEKEYKTLPLVLAPCHNDLNLGNFLKTKDMLYLIDFEYSGLNDPAWDLAYFFNEAKFGVNEQDWFMGEYVNRCYSEDMWRRKIELLMPLVIGVNNVWEGLIRQ